jgi:hypothetical protein
MNIGRSLLPYLSSTLLHLSPQKSNLFPIFYLVCRKISFRAYFYWWLKVEQIFQTLVYLARIRVFESIQPLQLKNLGIKKPPMGRFLDLGGGRWGLLP